MSVPPPNHHCPGMPFHSCTHRIPLLPCSVRTKVYQDDALPVLGHQTLKGSLARAQLGGP